MINAKRFIRNIFSVISCICLLAFHTNAQNLDSLKKCYLNKKLPDSVRLQALDDWSWFTNENDPDSSIVLAKLLLKEAKKMPKYFAIAYNNLGSAYMTKGDFPKALNYMNKSLLEHKKRGNKGGEATLLNNIGNIYFALDDQPKAFSYYSQSYKVYTSIKNTDKICMPTLNLGIYYLNANKYDSAYRYISQAIKINERIGNIADLAQCYCNMGRIFEFSNTLDSALYYIRKSDELDQITNNILNKAYTQYSYATIYTKQKAYDKAIACALKSFELFEQIEAYDALINVSFLLNTCYSKTGDFKSANQFLQEYIRYTDSTRNETKNNAFLKNEIRFQYEKKQLSDSLAQVKRDEIMAANMKVAKLRNHFMAGGIIALLVFLYFLYRRFKVTQWQKKIIEEQKIIVDIKNKEVLDSIKYAKKIQHTLLAHQSLLQQNLPQHFVFYKPKDIVSGDFYWACETENEFYLAICDSTGHGVPGAFMSLLNISFLNEAINEKKIQGPGEVFNFVRNRLIENISQDGARDGMDGVLLKFSKNQNRFEIHYVAANIHPIIIRNGEIITLAYDKMHVGSGVHVTSFTTHKIEIQKNDILYIFTDGFADQFGGENGKKFKSKNLHQLLLKNSDKESQSICQNLESSFNEWKGGFEQTDDVCIIGIRF